MLQCSAQPEVLIALQQAWPGVRIMRLDLQLDDRVPNGWGDELAVTLTTYITLSADEAILVRLGLLSPQHAVAIPACGYKSFGALKVYRGKRLTRLEAFWDDPAPDARMEEWNKAAEPIRDAIAPIIARMIWNPWAHRRISGP